MHFALPRASRSAGALPPLRVYIHTLHHLKSRPQLFQTTPFQGDTSSLLGIRDTRKKTHFTFLFFLPAYRWCYPSVISCAARHDQIEYTLYDTRGLRHCTARHCQIVCTGIAPWSSLAQRGVARLCLPVLALGHHLHSKAWPQ